MGTHTPSTINLPGSQLLQRSLAVCAEDPDIRSAELHVHCGDDDAQGWYAKRGFVVKVRAVG